MTVSKDQQIFSLLVWFRNQDISKWLWVTIRFCFWSQPPCSSWKLSHLSYWPISTAHLHSPPFNTDLGYCQRKPSSSCFLPPPPIQYTFILVEVSSLTLVSDPGLWLIALTCCTNEYDSRFHRGLHWMSWSYRYPALTCWGDESLLMCPPPLWIPLPLWPVCFLRLYKFVDRSQYLSLFSALLNSK